MCTRTFLKICSFNYAIAVQPQGSDSYNPAWFMFLEAEVEVLIIITDTSLYSGELGIERALGYRGGELFSIHTMNADTHNYVWHTWTSSSILVY